MERYAGAAPCQLGAELRDLVGDLLRQDTSALAILSSRRRFLRDMRGVALSCAVVLSWPGIVSAEQGRAQTLYPGQQSPTPASGTGDEWLQVSAGGHARWRTKVWRNFLFADTNDDTFNLFRVFGHTDWRLGQHVRIFLEGKTAHAWSRTLPGGRRSAVDADEFDIRSTFVEGRFSPTGRGEAMGRRWLRLCDRG